MKIFLLSDSFLAEPEEDIIKYRAVGPVRTKASLAITFNLFGTSFMIINSHFEGEIVLFDGISDDVCFVIQRVMVPNLVQIDG